jgi:hypothetical protein
MRTIAAPFGAESGFRGLFCQVNARGNGIHAGIRESLDEVAEREMASILQPSEGAGGRWNHGSSGVAGRVLRGVFVRVLRAVPRAAAGGVRHGGGGARTAPAAGGVCGAGVSAGVPVRAQVVNAAASRERPECATGMSLGRECSDPQPGSLRSSAPISWKGDNRSRVAQATGGPSDRSGRSRLLAPPPAACAARLRLLSSVHCNAST